MTAIAAGARAWLDHRLHTKELFTTKRHYTIIDAPGHRDSIKNRIKGASLADVALILVPADGNFTTAIARGSHKACETRGHMRQHLRPIKLLCVKQSRIGVNKMNYDSTGYGKDRYDENANKIENMDVIIGSEKSHGNAIYDTLMKSCNTPKPPRTRPRRITRPSG